MGMLTKLDKAKLRSTIFRHLDGLATATTSYALHKKGVLQHIFRITVKSMFPNSQKHLMPMKVISMLVCAFWHLKVG